MENADIKALATALKSLQPEAVTVNATAVKLPAFWSGIQSTGMVYTSRVCFLNKKSTNNRATNKVQLRNPSPGQRHGWPRSEYYSESAGKPVRHVETGACKSFQQDSTREGSRTAEP